MKKYCENKNLVIFKMFFLCTIFLFVCSSFVIINDYIYAAQTTWQDVCGSVKMQKDSNGYYIITNANELAYASSKMSNSANFILRANIDLSGNQWYPWGTFNSQYSGIFNGNGFSISNMQITDTNRNSSCAGLFSWVGSCTIKNLYLKDISIITSTKTDFTGGLVAEVNSGNATIQNCQVSGNIVIDNSTYTYGGMFAVGGIVGRNCNDKSSNITECTNYVNISYYVKIGGSELYAGGIIGKNASGSSNISKNINFGNITSSDSDVAYCEYVGGIAGASFASTNYCVNYGEIRAGNNSYVFRCNVGGIVGYESSSITNCMNRANIYGKAQIQTSATVVGNSYSNVMIHQHQHLGWFIWLTDEAFYSRSYTNQFDRYELAIVGGISGSCSNSIYNSYSMGNVEGGSSFRQYSVTESFSYKVWGDGIASHDYSSSYSHTVSYYTSSYTDYIDGSKTNLNNCFYNTNNSLDYNKYSSYDLNNGKLKVYFKGSQVTSDVDTLSYTKTADSFGDGWDSSNAKMKMTCAKSNNGYKVSFTDEFIDCLNRANEVNGINKNVLIISSNSIQQGGTGSYDMANENIGSEWSVNSDINNGYPYLKCLYWYGVGL